MVHFVHSYNSELLKIVTSSSAQDSYSMLFSFSAWRRAEELFIFPSAGANVGVSSCSMPNLPHYRSLRRAAGPPRACFPWRFLGKGTRQAAEDKTSSFRFPDRKQASHLDGKRLLPPTEPSSHSHGEALMQNITERSAAAKSY